MVRRVLLALLLAASSGCLVTRTARPRIEGTVYEATTDRPLPDVLVRTFDGDAQAHRTEAVTDARGRFPVAWLTRTGYEDAWLEECDPRGGGSTDAIRRVEATRMRPLPNGGE